MPRKPRQLSPDDLVTATAKGDFGFHPTLGAIIKGAQYTVRAGAFPFQILERPEGVLFPGEEPAARKGHTDTDGQPITEEVHEDVI